MLGVGVGVGVGVGGRRGTVLLLLFLLHRVPLEGAGRRVTLTGRDYPTFSTPSKQ